MLSAPSECTQCTQYIESHSVHSVHGVHSVHTVHSVHAAQRSERARGLCLQVRAEIHKCTQRVVSGEFMRHVVLARAGHK